MKCEGLSEDSMDYEQGQGHQICYTLWQIILMTMKEYLGSWLIFY